ncbi:MAG: hypothetical protein QXV22_04035 [Thermoplasmataceae archaeon]
MTDVYQEAQRQLTICNACRYCEGFCAVWDAIEYRSALDLKDMPYLANLCHDCRDCYYVCPFNEPDHEYALNIPKILSKARIKSYKDAVWPAFMSVMLDRPAIFALSVTLIALIGSIGYPIFILHAYPLGAVSLISLIPEATFRYITLGVYLYTAILWTVSGLKFAANSRSEVISGWLGALNGAAAAFSQRFFFGGGVGCKYPSENSRFSRAIFHASVLYGFITALISIAFYPNITGLSLTIYATASLLMTFGSLGLLLWDITDSGTQRSPEMRRLDVPFTVLIFLSGLTGVAFILLSGSYFYGLLFLIHDALILAVFAIAPYSKFLHPLYRVISLAKFYAERKFYSQLH